MSFVHELWFPGTRSWNRERVQDLYGDVLSDKICEIPLPGIDLNDRIIWFHSTNGCYTTKSGYSWLLLRRIGLGFHKFFWRQIWKLRLPPKVHMFAWRLGNEFLPTNLKLVTINPEFNKFYPRCNNSEESAIHAVRSVKKRKIFGCLIVLMVD